MRSFDAALMRWTRRSDDEGIAQEWDRPDDARLRDGRAGRNHDDGTVGADPGGRRRLSVRFSKSVLARAPRRLVTVRARGVEWSDWGSIRRVVESLRHVGSRPFWLAQAESMLIT